MVLCTCVHWTSHCLQGTRNTRPCLTGSPVGEGRYPLAAADGVPLYIRRPALRGPDPGTVPPGQIRSMVSRVGRFKNKLS